MTDTDTSDPAADELRRALNATARLAPAALPTGALHRRIRRQHRQRLLGTAAAVVLLAGGVSAGVAVTQGPAAAPARVATTPGSAPALELTSVARYRQPRAGRGCQPPERTTAYRECVVLGSQRLVVDHVIRADVVQSLREAPFWIVDVHLSTADAQRYAALTGRLTGHELAIIVDGRVLSAPTVEHSIGDGTVAISSPGGTRATAQSIARQLLKH